MNAKVPNKGEFYLRSKGCSETCLRSEDEQPLRTISRRYRADLEIVIFVVTDSSHHKLNSSVKWKGCDAEHVASLVYFHYHMHGKSKFHQYFNPFFCLRNERGESCRICSLMRSNYKPQGMLDREYA